MKTNKTNVLLFIIAVNLTIISLVQLEIWPAKAKANQLGLDPSVNYGLVPLDKNGSINVNVSSYSGTQDVNIKYINGWNAANYEAYRIDGEKYSSLGVVYTN
tara:strand:+ start:1779 stop:2084 length:306 start_codon:yes stop_codon:yes gene_type:complete